MTMIELMTVLSILAILVTIALPGFQHLLNTSRLTGQANDLVADLALARNEAGSRSRKVHLCIAASSTTCATTGTNWEVGRIVWVDINADGALNAASSEIIKYVPPLSGNVTLVAANFSNTADITFSPYGGLTPSTSGSFTLCANRDAQGRSINVSAIGRAIASRKYDCPTS